jgi:hypothetical protein
MLSLESLLVQLSSVGIQAQVWIDGGFMTKKIDPDDVDLVVVIQAPEFEAAMGVPAKKAVIVGIVKQQFTRPVKCDSYLNLEYPPDSPRYTFGQKQRDYWLKTFGESRRGEKKGIAVLKVPVQ